MLMEQKFLPNTLWFLFLAVQLILSKQRLTNCILQAKKTETVAEIQPQKISIDTGFFYTGKGDSKTPVTGRCLCVLTNREDIKKILSLWGEYRDNQKAKFERGYSGLRDLFNTLVDIHLWGNEERFLSTGIVDQWKDDISVGSTTPLLCEFELFYRKDEGNALSDEKIVKDYIQDERGTVLSRFRSGDIRYHAVLAEMPLTFAENVVKRQLPDHSALKKIMFCRPAAQSFPYKTPNLSLSSSPVSLKESVPSSSEPVVALLDGLPETNHPALSGQVKVFDCLSISGKYPTTSSMKHGTSMASFILHGDLGNSEGNRLQGNIISVPIMAPVSGFYSLEEAIPRDRLFVDELQTSVRYLLELNPKTNGVRIINLSVGIPDFLFYGGYPPSPAARMIDYLSDKYGVLFIISAGNSTMKMNLPCSFDDFKKLHLKDRDAAYVKNLSVNYKNCRILSPGESINALTVGSLSRDFSGWEEDALHAVPCSNTMVAPYSSFGPGICGCVKPDLVVEGGNMPLLGNPNGGADLSSVAGPNGPGVLAAAPGFTGNRYSYIFGTSNSAALVTHEAALCYSFLNEFMRKKLNGTGIPSDYSAFLVKAMLIHGSDYSSIAKDLFNKTSSGELKNILFRSCFGYGVPDFSLCKGSAPDSVTLFGYGEIPDEKMITYYLPLPFDFSSSKVQRKLTLTLAYFSPISPSSLNYKELDLTLASEDTDGGKLFPTSEGEAMGKTISSNGTVIHRILTGKSSIDSSPDKNGEKIKIISHRIGGKVDKKHKTKFALFVTFTFAAPLGVSAYETIRSALQTKVDTKVPVEK